MVVAITSGMENIENGLKSIGYDVVRYGEYSMPVDAVVYYGSHLSAGKISMSNFESDRGILMINATNMSLYDIDNCLKNKTYSPLLYWLMLKSVV